MQRGAQGRDLPRGAWTPRGSHSRRHPARGLDERAGPRLRAPRCRREAAPVVTVATRKWRRGLARASRGLEEPRPRGPARRHTARSRDSPFRCSSSSESRSEVLEGRCGSTGHSAGSSPTPAEDPGVRPRGARGRQEKRGRRRGTRSALGATVAVAAAATVTSNRLGDPSRRPSRRTGSGHQSACVHPLRKRSSPAPAEGRAHRNC